MPGEASPASHPVAQPAKNTVPANAARAASRCAIITLASPSRPSSSHSEAQSADRKLHRYFLVNGKASSHSTCRSDENEDELVIAASFSWFDVGVRHRAVPQRRAALAALRPSEDRLDGFIGDRFAQPKPGELVRFQPACGSSATSRLSRASDVENWVLGSV